MPVVIHRPAFKDGDVINAPLFNANAVASITGAFAADGSEPMTGAHRTIAGSASNTALRPNGAPGTFGLWFDLTEGAVHVAGKLTVSGAVTLDGVTVQTATVETLTATTGTVETLTATTGTVETLTATTGTITNLTVTEKITTEELSAADAEMVQATIVHADIETAEVETLTATNATIETATVEEATVQDLTATKAAATTATVTNLIFPTVPGKMVTKIFAVSVELVMANEGLAGLREKLFTVDVPGAQIGDVVLLASHPTFADIYANMLFRLEPREALTDKIILAGVNTWNTATVLNFSKTVNVLILRCEDVPEAEEEP